MDTKPYTLISPPTRPDYRELISGVSESVWPEFMLHDPVANRLWDDLFERFPEYQFALMDPAAGKVISIGNSVPLAWPGRLEDLPDEGWDWALEKAVNEHIAGEAPQRLCGLQISITPDYQRRGVSSTMLKAMSDLARRKSLPSVVVPVRPSLKSRYPLIPMKDYIRWENPESLPFDPWLRVHVRHGGEIVRVCHRAMTIAGSVSEWEAWTGMAFPASGSHIVPGALVPVEIDLAEDMGVYVEPNVWMVHRIPPP